MEITGPSFLTMDPPRHDLLRDVVREPFRPGAVAELEERVRAHVDALLPGLDDVSDVVASFARRLPVRVICDLMGFPPEDELLLKNWSDLILERVPDDDRTPDAARQAADSMRAYFVEQLAQRRTRPRMDLVGLIVGARVEAEPLPEDEQVGMCFLLFEAGNSTTTSLLANGLLVLTRHPDQRRWLVDHPDQVAEAIEEILRFESPVQNMGRTTVSDVELHGVRSSGDRSIPRPHSAQPEEPAALDAPPGQSKGE